MNTVNTAHTPKENKFLLINQYCSRQGDRREQDQATDFESYKNKTACNFGAYDPNASHTFIKNINDPNFRLNQYFAKKYQQNIRVIQEFRETKSRMETPFKNAEKSINNLMQTTNMCYYTDIDRKLGHQHTVKSSVPFSQTATSKFRFGASGFGHLKSQRSQESTARQYRTSYEMSQFGLAGTRQTTHRKQSKDITEALQFREVHLMNLQKLACVEGQLTMLIDFVGYQMNSQPPPFPEYWENMEQLDVESALAEFQLKWRIIFATSVQLQMISVAMCQFIYLSRASAKCKSQPAIEASPLFPKVLQLLLTILKIDLQNLLILIDETLKKRLFAPTQSNEIWKKQLEFAIAEKKIANLQNDYQFQAKQNNQFIDFQLKDLFTHLSAPNSPYRQTGQKIQQMLLVIQYCIQSKRKMSIQQVYENLINSVYVTIGLETEKDTAVLRNLYIGQSYKQPPDNSILILNENSSRADNQQGTENYHSREMNIQIDANIDEHPLQASGAESEPQQQTSRMDYTAVLELDDVLGHFNQPKQVFYKRPRVDEFLRDASKLFNIVIFTAAIKPYADQIINQIDVGKVVRQRFYREHTVAAGNNQVWKDLEKVGLDPKKTVIIDHDPQSFRAHQANGILLKQWTGEESDVELDHLKNLLKKLTYSKPSDIRLALKQYRDFKIRQIFGGWNSVHVH